MMVNLKREPYLDSLLEPWIQEWYREVVWTKKRVSPGLSSCGVEGCFPGRMINPTGLRSNNSGSPSPAEALRSKLQFSFWMDRLLFSSLHSFLRTLVGLSSTYRVWSSIGWSCWPCFGTTCLVCSWSFDCGGCFSCQLLTAWCWLCSRQLWGPRFVSFGLWSALWGR